MIDPVLEELYCRLRKEPKKGPKRVQNRHEQEKCLLNFQL